MLFGLLVAVFVLHSAWAVYTQTAKPPGPLRTERVKGDLHMIAGEGGNVALYATNDGVILVDDMLVLVAVAVAGQRDFAQVPRLARAVAAGDDPQPALSAIVWLDRVVLLLAVVIVYLGLAVSRA